MENINKIIELSKEYVSKGYKELEAVKKAQKEIQEKENNKYGIYSSTFGSYR